MELTIDQQIFELLKKSNNLLIVLPEQLNSDAVASGLALRLFLVKMEKLVVLASSGSLPEQTSFLPGWQSVTSSIPSGQTLVISLDTSAKPLEEISYQTKTNKAEIYVKSKAQAFTPADLSFSQEKSHYDLIICLGVKSLADLGGLHEENVDLFFETPKINIDNQPGNEYFGTVNLVEITSTSVAEILSDLLQKYEEQLIDQDIATCLLTGIIAKTKSFQHVQTTPKAFLRASELVALGGRQQEIIKQIYQTKSLPLLRLWGRALARMKTVEQKAIYSMLSLADFEKAGAGVGELFLVLTELLENVSGYQVAALLAEPVKDQVSLLLAIHEQLPAESFLKKLPWELKPLAGSSQSLYRYFEINGISQSLESLEQQLLTAI